MCDAFIARLRLLALRILRHDGGQAAKGNNLDALMFKRLGQPGPITREAFAYHTEGDL